MAVAVMLWIRSTFMENDDRKAEGKGLRRWLVGVVAAGIVLLVLSSGSPGSYRMPDDV